MLAADNWCVRVDDKVYGPYSFHELRKFATQGRLARSSMIAPAGGREWRRADQEQRFAEFFGLGRNRAEPQETTFGRRFGGHGAPAARAQEAREAPIRLSRHAGPQPISRRNRAVAAELANFVVVFDVVSGAASRVETTILSIGQAFQISENVWNVSCRMTANGVRNAIAPFLRPNESIFVVDTTNGGATWQNYAPEAHAKLTESYIKFDLKQADKSKPVA